MANLTWTKTELGYQAKGEWGSYAAFRSGGRFELWVDGELYRSRVTLANAKDVAQTFDDDRGRRVGRTVVEKPAADPTETTASTTLLNGSNRDASPSGNSGFRRPAYYGDGPDGADPMRPETTPIECERGPACLAAMTEPGEQCEVCGGTAPATRDYARTDLPYPGTEPESGDRRCFHGNPWGGSCPHCDGHNQPKGLANGARWTDVPEMAADEVEEADRVRHNTESKPASSLVAKLTRPAANGKGRPPHVIVIARAGTGKTTTLVSGLQVLKGLPPTDAKGRPITPSPQQKAVWDAIAESAGARTVCFAAFNSSIAEELKARVPPSCEAMTMHSMGYKAVNKQFGYQKPNEWAVKDALASLLGYNYREAVRVKPVEIKAAEDLVSLVKQTLAGYDFAAGRYVGVSEEELDDLVRHYGVEMSSPNGGRWVNKTEVYRLVADFVQQSLTPCGKISFDDMIWLPVVHNLPLFRYDLLLVDEAQDLNRCQQALAKMAGKRLVLCGDPCQPSGTRVLMSDGTYKPIEDLRAGDRVRSFDRGSGSFIQNGREVTGVTRREYSGELITIKSAGLESHYTSNHYCYVLLKPIANRWSVYLMRKGDYWRVGTSLLQNGAGVVGPMARKRIETADDVWILATFGTEAEAKVAEFKLSTEQRIPQLLFKAPNGPYQEATQDLIDIKWASLDKIELMKSALLILRLYGRSVDYPFNEMASKPGEFWATRPTKIRACNILPGSAVLHYKGIARYSREDFLPVDETRCRAVSGVIVYSMNVEKDHSYIADGIATFNCQAIYGFAGADSESMPRMTKELAAEPAGCVTLPLTVTRRCGKAIVAEARRFVKDFEAHEGNAEGLVSEAAYPIQKKGGSYWTGGDKETVELPWEETYGAKARPGDFVVCRVNAPLVSQCFKFLKRNVKATIQGRDIGKGIADQVKKLTGDNPGVSAAKLVERLGEWYKGELAKEEAKAEASEARLTALEDRFECLSVFCEEAKTAGDVLAKIDQIFTNRKDEPGVRLSSIHKAKGLEADRVFYLKPDAVPQRRRDRMKAWEIQQEENLEYVAVTRAAKELVYVY